MIAGYYVLVVWEDVEPELFGPYLSEKDRDSKALDLKEEHGDDHGIYWLNASDGLEPGEVGAYSGGFFIDGLALRGVAW